MKTSNTYLPKLSWKSKIRELVQTGLILLIILLSQVNTARAQDTTAQIHPSDLLNSIDFKQKQGRDRQLVFQKLENLIKPSSSFNGLAPDYDYYIGDYKMNSTELVSLIGEADEKIAPAIWQYFLSQDQRCKVIIGIDSDGMVSYIVKKDCL